MSLRNEADLSLRPQRPCRPEAAAWPGSPPTGRGPAWRMQPCPPQTRPEPGALPAHRATPTRHGPAGHRPRQPGEPAPPRGTCDAAENTPLLTPHTSFFLLYDPSPPSPSFLPTPPSLRGPQASTPRRCGELAGTSQSRLRLRGPATGHCRSRPGQRPSLDTRHRAGPAT